MSHHKVFLHPLYSHGTICIALSFLFLNLDFSVNYFFQLPPHHLLKEAGTDPHGRFLLYQLQQLLLGQGALLQVHIGGK